MNRGRHDHYFLMSTLADALMRLMIDNGHKCAQDGQNSAYEYGAVIA